MQYWNPRGLQPRKETCSPAAQRLLRQGSRGSTEAGRDVWIPRTVREVLVGWAESAVGPPLVTCSHGPGLKRGRDSTHRCCSNKQIFSTTPANGHRLQSSSVQVWAQATAHKFTARVCEGQATQGSNITSVFHYQAQQLKYSDCSCWSTWSPKVFELTG